MPMENFYSKLKKKKNAYQWALVALVVGFAPRLS